MGSISSIIIEFVIIIGLTSILIFYKPYEVITFVTLTGTIALITILILKKKSTLLGKDRQKFSLINLNNIMQSFGGIKEIKVNLIISSEYFSQFSL